MVNIKNRWRWRRGNKIGFKAVSHDLMIELTPYLDNKGVTGELIIPKTEVGAFLRESQAAIREFAQKLHDEAKGKPE